MAIAAALIAIGLGAAPALVLAQGRGDAPLGYGTAPQGYGDNQNYGAKPDGYGSAPPGYGIPPQGYGISPGYGATPPGYGRGLDSYGRAPPGYGIPPQGYGVPPAGYGASPGYGSQPQGYGQAPAGYGQAPGYGASPGYGVVPRERPSNVSPRPTGPDLQQNPKAGIPVPPATQGVTYHFDPDGRFLGATETIDTMTREYDANGKVVRTFVRRGREVVVFDAEGQVIQRTGARH
jgi:hypothetical protein